VGWWFVGVYGWRGCSYTIKATSQSQCPNLCSLRGTCSGSGCQCWSGFTGSMCETMSATMPQSTWVSGFVENNAWNYYRYNASSADNMLISIAQNSSIVADCDLFVKQGSLPTRFVYDYRDTGIQQQFNLSINDPGQAVWYIGVYGWSTCQYQIKIDETNACPGSPACSGHGTCYSDGACGCNPGYGSEDCSTVSNSLRNNQLYGPYNITTGQWQTYTFGVSSSSSFHVLVKEINTVGFIWVYASKGVPTLRNYDFSDTSLTKAVHVVGVDLTTVFSEVYQIGVYGNPFMVDGEYSQYYIIGT